ncbi:MAG TPA: NAD(P)H-dependent oxidoreductase [Candidatus Binatia bacterium]|nr:NAD(P)H-dependent oxidoreductase [Candidatus Binatia bacterium]
MAQVLYIEASPAKSSSHSIQVAKIFLNAYRHAHPQDDLATIDLWAEDLPPFDGETIEAKFAVLRKKEFTPEQQARWDAVQRISRRFNAADKYIFSVPMWNFGIPYRLKHYIDVVTLAGENWSWSRAAGYRSLLSGKKALLVCASAGEYGVNDPADFQKPYLRRWLNFIGVTEIQEISVAPTLADPDALHRTKCKAEAAAVQLAATF